uniref:NADPH-quinone oxidoreductase subunit Lic n=1 Tax=Rhizophora mucronata TaxID=61149 RepID=A0A2P2JXV1_RHIMU
MSYSFSFRIPKALPSLSSHHRKAPLHPASNNKLLCNKNKSCNKQNVTSTSREAEDCNEVKKSSLAIQLAAVLATVISFVTGFLWPTMPTTNPLLLVHLP